MTKKIPAVVAGALAATWLLTLGQCQAGEVQRQLLRCYAYGTIWAHEVRQGRLDGTTLAERPLARSPACRQLISDDLDGVDLEARWAPVRPSPPNPRRAEAAKMVEIAGVE